MKLPEWLKGLLILALIVGVVMLATGLQSGQIQLPTWNDFTKTAGSVFDNWAHNMDAQRDKYRTDPVQKEVP